MSSQNNSNNNNNNNDADTAGNSTKRSESVRSSILPQSDIDNRQTTNIKVITSADDYKNTLYQSQEIPLTTTVIPSSNNVYNNDNTLVRNDDSVDSIGIVQGQSSQKQQQQPYGTLINNDNDETDKTKFDPFADDHYVLDDEDVKLQQRLLQRKTKRQQTRRKTLRMKNKGFLFRCFLVIRHEFNQLSHVTRRFISACLAILVLFFLIGLISFVGLNAAASRVKIEDSLSTSNNLTFTEYKSARFRFCEPLGEDGSRCPDLVTILLNVTEISIVDRTIRASITLHPFGTFDNPFRNGLLFATTLFFNDVSVRFPAGGITFASTNIEIPLSQGSTASYPFDKHRTRELLIRGTFLPISSSTRQQVNLRVLSSGKINQWNVASQVQDISTSSNGSLLSVNIELNRIVTVKFFSVFMAIVILILSTLVLCLSLTLHFAKRTVEPPTMIVPLILLFSTPILRNRLPDIPVHTTIIDAVSYFWAVMFSSFAFILLIANYVDKYQRPGAKSVKETAVAVGVTVKKTVRRMATKRNTVRNKSSGGDSVEMDNLGTEK